MEHWNRTDVRDLIELYHSHECLWNVESSQYKDRNLRFLAMNDIHDRMKDSLPNISLDDIKKKIHTLRSQYNRERKSRITSMKSGAITNGIYTPKLWCFDSLQFLDDIAEGRQTTPPSMDGGFQVSKFETVMK